MILIDCLQNCLPSVNFNQFDLFSKLFQFCHNKAQRWCKISFVISQIFQIKPNLNASSSFFNISGFNFGQQCFFICNLPLRFALIDALSKIKPYLNVTSSYNSCLWPLPKMSQFNPSWIKFWKFCLELCLCSIHAGSLCPARCPNNNYSFNIWRKAYNYTFKETETTSGPAGISMCPNLILPAADLINAEI